jgi:hypothetical protein
VNDFFFSLMLLSALSGGTGQPMPFWATANQWGMMPVNQGTLAMVQARTEFDAARTLQLRWGASLAANSYADNLDPGSNPLHIMADELYGSLRWKVFTLDVGMKHRDLEFYGADARLGSLSTTGGHVAESGNARAMPGYLLSLEPVPIPWTGRHVWLYGAFGDYKPLGIRYVEDPLVHRTRIGFRFDIGSRVRLGFLLDHYAIWGGTIPDKGTMPVTFGNYFRMVTGRPAGADGTWNDRLNVIGDQGGGELWRAEYLGDGWSVELQHDIPYADGSGMGFQNFPDGVTTLHFGWNDKSRWVSDVLYEHTYTMYQSGPFNGERFDEEGHSLTPPGVKTTGGDNYFNNGEYRSGWTHYGRPVGTPLMYPKGTHAGTWTPATLVLGLENTRLKAHHFGMSGKLFRVHPYKLMLTCSANHGTYTRPYAGESAWDKEWGSVEETPLRQLSAGFTGSVRLAAASGRSAAAPASGRRPLDLSLLYGLYADRGSVLPDTFGVTLGARLSF